VRHPTGAGFDDAGTDSGVRRRILTRINRIIHTRLRRRRILTQLIGNGPVARDCVRQHINGDPAHRNDQVINTC